jgi:hypothetical protein
MGCFYTSQIYGNLYAADIAIESGETEFRNGNITLVRGVRKQMVTVMTNKLVSVRLAVT